MMCLFMTIVLMIPIHYNQLYSSSWFEVYGYMDDTP